MQTRTQQAVNLFQAGDTKKAFAIFKTFKQGLSKAEKRTIEIAYECLCGRAGFYQAIGINTTDEIQTALSIIQNKFIN